MTPNPIFPDALIRIDSTPPSVKAMVSAAGKKIPVFVSPAVVIAADDAEPAGKMPTLLTVKVVARRLVMVAEAEVSVVMLADVKLSEVVAGNDTA